MVLLPLGLGGPIFRFPVCTVLIAGLILVASLPKFQAIDDAQKIFMRSEHKLKALGLRLSLMQKLCSENRILNREACFALQKIETEKVSSFADPFFELERALGKRALQADVMREFQELLMRDSKLMEFAVSLNTHPNFEKWKQEESEFDSEMNEYLKKNKLLSKATMSLSTLSLAQFYHGGYLHLIGNLLFFLFLSIFVELRVGPLIYPALYLLPGFAGLAFQLWMTESLSTPLMGASANIAGISGAFLAFFWRSKLKVLFFTFYYNRVIWIPVLLFFPLIVVAADLVGALHSGLGGVAHWAHLGGFVTGFVLAFAMSRSQGLPEGFLFLEELQAYRDSRSLDLESALKKKVEILHLNPENHVVHKEIQSSIDAGTSWGLLSKGLQLYVLKHLPRHLENNPNSTDEILGTVKLVSLDWPLKEIFQSVSTRTLGTLLGKAEASQDWERVRVICAIYFSLHQKFQKDPKLIRLFQTAQKSLTQNGGACEPAV